MDIAVPPTESRQSFHLQSDSGLAMRDLKLDTRLQTSILASIDGLSSDISIANALSGHVEGPTLTRFSFGGLPPSRTLIGKAPGGTGDRRRSQPDEANRSMDENEKKRTPTYKPSAPNEQTTYPTTPPAASPPTLLSQSITSAQLLLRTNIERDQASRRLAASRNIVQTSTGPISLVSGLQVGPPPSIQAALFHSTHLENADITELQLRHQPAIGDKTLPAWANLLNKTTNDHFVITAYNSFETNNAWEEKPQSLRPSNYAKNVLVSTRIAMEKFFPTHAREVPRDALSTSFSWLRLVTEAMSTRGRANAIHQLLTTDHSTWTSALITAGSQEVTTVITSLRTSPYCITTDDDGCSESFVRNEVECLIRYLEAFLEYIQLSSADVGNLQWQGHPFRQSYLYELGSIQLTLLLLFQAFGEKLQLIYSPEGDNAGQLLPRLPAPVSGKQDWLYNRSQALGTSLDPTLADLSVSLQGHHVLIFSSVNRYQLVHAQTVANSGLPGLLQEALGQLTLALHLPVYRPSEAGDALAAKVGASGICI